MRAIGALHLPQEQEGDETGGDGKGVCELCCGAGGDGGACGGDDALAMSTGLSVVGEGRKEFFGGMKESCVWSIDR